VTRVKITNSGDGEGALSDESGGSVPDAGDIVESSEGTYRVTGTKRYASDDREDVVQAEVEEV